MLREPGTRVLQNVLDRTHYSSGLRFLLIDNGAYASRRLLLGS
jgi:hypothetical protein